MLFNQDNNGFDLLIKIDWWFQINCKMSEKKGWQLNYIKKQIIFLIENVSVTKKSFLKENLHNI